VTVNRGNESARGSAAVYDFNRRLIIMSGGVSLRRGSDTLNGGRLVIDLNTGLSTVDGRASGGSSGRVSGTFQVPGE
jgi:lipopolysaccharide export system protein LptA